MLYPFALFLLVIVVFTTINTAVALRISKILRDKNMSQYRLEKIIAMPHNTMKTFMGERNKSVNLKTVLRIVRGLEMTNSEFLMTQFLKVMNWKLIN